MRQLAVASSKGGVGKSAITTGIGAALAKQGRSVLVVDADPQGNATEALGITATTTWADALMAGAPLASTVVEARERLHVAPGGRPVGALEGWLYQDLTRRMALRVALAAMGQAAFDVVLIDTAPGHSMVNLASYVAATDGLLVPCAPDGLSLRGVRGVEENIELLRQAGLPAPEVFMAVPTFADRRHGRTALVQQALLTHFGTRCAPQVRVCSDIASAMANGVIVYEFAPRSRAVADFDAVAVHLQALLATQATENTEST